MSVGADVVPGTRVAAACPNCHSTIELLVPDPSGAPSRPLQLGQLDAQSQAIVRANGFSDVTQDENQKNYRQYMFVIAVGGVQETAWCRFSRLRESHPMLVQGANLDFPSRHIFSDMNKIENAGRRSGELQTYLMALLNGCDSRLAGRIVTNPLLHSSLNLNPGLVAALMQLGNVRLIAEQQRQQAEAARLAEMRRREEERRQIEAARLAVIRQQHIDDMEFAQRVNHHGAGQPLTLLFPRQTTFELRTKMFSWRDQVAIKGPGGFDWFGMLRASSIFSMMDTEVIGTRQGEPLLALHRQFRWMHYEYRLDRVTAGGQSFPLCSVTRQPQLFAPATYTVQMLAPSFGGQIYCQGQWFEDFVLYQEGVPACRIRRRMWSIPECYDVIIEPNRDVLLFLGIACAIDHIHHEIEENQRR